MNSLQKISILLILALVWISSGCEKDDICDPATATTPQVVIDFYDITNPTLTKNVTNLLVVGEGMDTGIAFNGVNTIKIPLKITADTTTFQFILNYGNTVTPSLVNSDVLEFKYTRNNIYVSRACGYKTLFTLDETNPYALSELDPAGTSWIKNISVNQYQITNENETHINVFF
ncbi:MAG: hypothetical protein RL699_713 [Bacteroidota bacterium]|jgi:hypothetical protein